MTKKYTFVEEETCEDTGMVSTKMHTFTTEGEQWNGFDGPMYNFYDFLRGCGYVFGQNAMPGIMREKFGKCGEEEFVPAVEW